VTISQKQNKNKKTGGIAQLVECLRPWIQKKKKKKDTCSEITEVRW
jgi:hypothetical protein